MVARRNSSFRGCHRPHWLMSCLTASATFRKKTFVGTVARLVRSERNLRARSFQKGGGVQGRWWM